MTPGPLPDITGELDDELTRAPLVDAANGTLKQIATARDLLDAFRADFNDGEWIFRGHSSSKHCLRPSLEVKSDARREVLAELQKMNINRATLFPGLDGFAASLHTNWEMVSPNWFDTWTEE
jgi:hypothetical protein